MNHLKQVDQTKNHEFMAPIYQKVAKLKRSLPQYDSKLQQYQQNNQNIFTPYGNEKNNMNHKAFVKTNSNVKLSSISINNQLTINRQDYIDKERAKASSFGNFRILQNKKIQKNFNFAQTHDNFKKQVKISRRTYSCTNLNKLKNSQIKNNSQKKACNEVLKNFQSQPRFGLKSIQKNGNNTQLNSIKSQYSKSKTQRKMSRMLNFLDKNESKYKQQIFKNNNKNKIFIHNQIKLQKKEQTQQKQIDYLQIQQDQGDQFANQAQFQKLKHEKATLQQNSDFKPIGSAKNVRKSHHSSKLSNMQKQEVDQNKTIVIKSNLSNYSFQKQQKIKYLQKGKQLRVVLQKKLLKNKSNQNSELIYVHDYDQWVPAKLLKQNKTQVEKYLHFLLGQRKQTKHKKICLPDIDVVYI